MGVEITRMTLARLSLSRVSGRDGPQGVKGKCRFGVDGEVKETGFREGGSALCKRSNTYDP